MHSRCVWILMSVPPTLPDVISHVCFNIVDVVVPVCVPLYFDPSILDIVRISITVEFDGNERCHPTGVFRMDGLNQRMCLCSIND
jgi:hypothetical protein